MKSFLKTGKTVKNHWRNYFGKVDVLILGYHIISEYGTSICVTQKH